MRINASAPAGSMRSCRTSSPSLSAWPSSAPRWRTRWLRRGPIRTKSEILQQPLDVIELELWAEALAVPLAQFLENAARALHVDLARNLDRGVVAVVAATQRPAERIGVLVGALV